MESHDSLADVPINSVLIGLFSESLKTLADHESGYPDFITIQGTGTSKVPSRTYKFKTSDIRHYLSGLQDVIDTVLSNFIPDTFTEVPISTSKSLTKQESMDNPIPKLSKPKFESSIPKLSEPKFESPAKNMSDAKLDSEEEAISELEEETPSTTNEPSMNIESHEGSNNSLKGGSRKIHKRKLSFKKRK